MLSFSNLQNEDCSLNRYFALVCSMLMLIITIFASLNLNPYVSILISSLKSNSCCEENWKWPLEGKLMSCQNALKLEEEHLQWTYGMQSSANPVFKANKVLCTHEWVGFRIIIQMMMLKKNFDVQTKNIHHLSGRFNSAGFGPQALILAKV